MRSRRDRGETEPVEVLADDDWRDATPVTTSSRGRRWWELVAVLAGLAAVVAIGAAGSSGADDDATDMPRTTSTTVRRTTTTDWTQSTRPTTTTSFPDRVAASGPVLGPEHGATGTALVVIEESGGIAVLDLDTGALCRHEVPNGVWMPWDLPGTSDRTVLAGDGITRSIDVDCDVRDLGFQASGWFMMLSGEHVWEVRDERGTEIVERSLLDGEPARTMELGPLSMPTMTGDGSALVIGAGGYMTLVDAVTGERTDLGPGAPLAFGNGTLVSTRCPGLACELVVRDVDSGRERVVDGGSPPVPWEMGGLSPNGRYLRFQGADHPRLLDLETGEAKVLPVTSMPARFTADSEWLVTLPGPHIRLTHIESGEVVDLRDTFDDPVQVVATISPRR